MDVDEDTLDWGGNDDEEGPQQQGQQGSDVAPKALTATKDEATLSGAESLLALASGGASADYQDDKDSDVVSLGGGEDDMEELYAYQSRTHLGGAASGDTDPSIRAAPSPTVKAGAASEGKKREKARPAPASLREGVSQLSRPTSNDTTPEALRPHSKSNSQGKPQSNDHTRSPSTSRLLPPTGSLALPPKPVAAPTTPYVRPSHPSIMSASSMAPRERERDPQWENRDNSKGKSGSHSHASPESDALPLAPGWETRRSRGDSQETYFYNTKTHQSTWNRSIATGSSTSNHEGSQSPAYARGRTRQSGRVSPLGRDTAHSSMPDSGPQSHSRSDPFNADTNAPSIANQLTFEERHYRPNDNRQSPRSPLHDNGNWQRPSGAGLGPSILKRDPSPISLPAPPPPREKDRDRFLSRREQDRDRGPNERIPLRFNGELSDRNGERNVERERSRSPGRGRSSQRLRPGDVASNPVERDVPGSSRDHRAPAPRETSRPFGGSPPPLHRGASQVTRLRSPDYEERPRYPLPNHEQSSSRRRSLSPSEQLRKRTRSLSPVFTNPNRSQLHRHPQPRRDPTRWDDSDPARQREGPYQPVPFNGHGRDRPHQPLDMPDLLAAKIKDNDKLRNGDGDGNRFRDRENDAKRRKTADNSDSAPARRSSLDTRVDDNDSPRRKRQPLPPQSERFKEMASTPQSRPPTNGAFPPGIPSGPRRASLIRDAPHADLAQPGRPAQQPRFSDPKGGLLADGKYDEIERGIVRPRERERDWSADLPTGPRAMEVVAEPPLIRRPYSPPRRRVDRSPPPHLAGSKIDRLEEPRRDIGNDWARRGKDRQPGAEMHEISHSASPFPSASRFNQQQPPSRPPFNPKLSGANNLPVAPRKPVDVDPSLSRAGLPSRPQELPARGDRQSRRPRGPNSPEDSFRPQVLPGHLEGQRRQSFSEAEFNKFGPRPRPRPRASLSPLNSMKSLPDTSRPPRLHIQPPYPSTQPKPDRPLLPEEQDTQAVWDRSEHSASNSPVEVRAAFSDFPHVEYGIASPPPSSRRSSHAPENGRSQSPNADVRANQEHGDGPTLAAGMHPERARVLAAPSTASPAPGPRGGRPSRFRRQSKPPDDNGAGPPHAASQGPPRAVRTGSLLDRLSNPNPSPVTPLPLHERMDGPGDRGNWKNAGGPSLRDRVEDDTRYLERPPAPLRWDRAPEDVPGPAWGGRRDRGPRKRGRGQ